LNKRDFNGEEQERTRNARPERLKKELIDLTFKGQGGHFE
jgi:hypothetical protein